jgi:hypothetical protein
MDKKNAIEGASAADIVLLTEIRNALQSKSLLSCDSNLRFSALQTGLYKTTQFSNSLQAES